MKPGITLIELIMALGFSAIICTVLISSIFQIINGKRIAVSTIENDMRYMLFNTYFEKDIVSAFIPIQAINEPFHDKKQKKIEKVFYAVNKGENIKFLSFITSNLIFTKQAAQPKSSKTGILRVTYRLTEDPTRKDFFILFRQESAELYAPFKTDEKADKGYELISGIKNMKLTYSIKDQKNINKENEIEYETYKEWTDEQIKKKLLLPNIIHLELILWTEDLGEKKYEANYPLFEFELKNYEDAFVETSVPSQQRNLPIKGPSSFKIEEKT